MNPLKWMRALFLAVLAVTVAAPLDGAEEKPSQRGITHVTTIEGISEYRLDNGLKVLLFPDPSKATVTVNLTVFVGSRHEGYGETGMAHLLEHMLFKGTPTHSNVPKALKDRGARYNGTTWLDRTNYYETLPAEGDNLEFAIRLEADRMVNSLIRGEDLKSEMTVVRNEFERGENNPESILSQRMMATAFEWHNYGKATIGNRADIERVPVESLRAFYRKYYQPDNAMLVVAGRFEPEQAMKLVAKHFGPIPRPEQKPANTYTEEPPQDGERFVTLRRVGDVAMVGAVFHVPSGPHPDYPAVAVLEQSLTDAPSGRLYKALVETQKAARVSGSAYPLHDPGALEVMVEVSTGNDPQVVLGAMLDALDEVATEGITEAEVERARRRLLKQRELAAADSQRIAVQLSEWAAQGDWRLYFVHRDRLEQVTAEDVSRVAAKYLQRNNRTVGTYVPTKQPEQVAIPQAPELAKIVGDYKGRDAIAAGEAFDVSPENIEARTRRLTLPGGPRLALLEKKTRGEAVTMRVTLRYGNEKNLRGLAAAADFLPSLMLRGTKDLTRQELQDELDKHQATLRAEGSPTGLPGTAAFVVETKREHLPAVLGLLRQVLREPTLPADELELLKRAYLASYEQRRTDPDALATTEVRRRLDPWSKDDPRYVPSIDEEIERIRSVTVEDVRKLYDEYLGAGHAVVTVVGDFDGETTLPALKKTLVGWTASQPYAHLARNGDNGVKGTARDIATPGKENATYFAAMTFPVRDDHADIPALEIGNFILGGGGLSSRLADRVRQKEGLSYGVGSGYSASSLDERSAFYVYASCKPTGMGQVKQAVREEIDRLLKDGITEEELEAARRGYLQGQRVSRTDDGRLARLLEESLMTDRTMEYHAELEKKVASLTCEDVAKAMRRHVDPGRLVIVAAGDFKPVDREQEDGAEK